MLINLESPVELLSYDLYKSKGTGEIYCSLTFNNLSFKAVKAIKATLYGYDDFNGFIKDEEVKIQYRNGLKPNLKQEADDKVALSRKDIRRLEIDIETVLFEDGIIWEKSTLQTEEVDLYKINDSSLLSFLWEKEGPDAQYLSKDCGDKWQCICGRFNYQYQTRCQRCGRERDVVLKDYSDHELLINEMKAEEAEKKKQEKERQNELQKQKAIKMQRLKKITLYASIALLLIGTIGTFVFGHMTNYTFSWYKFKLLQDKNNQLINAVKNEKADDINFLIDKNANPNFVNDKSKNAIAEAMKLGNESLVNSLLNKDAAKIEIGEKNDTLAHLASENNQVAILKKMHDLEFNMNAENEKGETVIYPAIKEGNIAIVNYLIDKDDLDLQEIDGDNDNAIQVALLYQLENIDLIDKLLNLDIDLTKENNKGRNTYERAILSENTDIIKKFISEGLNINNIGDNSDNVLHFYVKNRSNAAFLEKLINMGVNVNAFNADGSSPLSLAIKNDRTQQVETLLENDANTNRVTKDGETALEVTEKTGDKKLKDIIKEHNKSNVPEDDLNGNPSEQTINYTITKDGIVDINSDLTEINIKVNDKITLNPTIKGNSSERVLVDSSVLKVLNEDNFQATQVGSGYITIIPNGYDWEESIKIAVNIN